MTPAEEVQQQRQQEKRGEQAHPVLLLQAAYRGERVGALHGCVDERPSHEHHRQQEDGSVEPRLDFKGDRDGKCHGRQLKAHRRKDPLRYASRMGMGQAVFLRGAAFLATGAVRTCVVASFSAARAAFAARLAAGSLLATAFSPRVTSVL